MWLLRYVITKALDWGSEINHCLYFSFQNIPGVIDIVLSKDVPGRNSFNVPELQYPSNMEIFCEGEVKYNGQVVGLAIAETEGIAHKAAKLVSIEYEAPPSDRKNTYTIRDALKIPNNPRVTLESQKESANKGERTKTL